MVGGDSMDDDKKKLGYRPNIEYEEDYYSEGAIKPTKNDDDDQSNDSNIEYDNGIMDHIQDNIDHLVQVIPILPDELQTAVNQVFKPIFNDWYSNLKGHNYPKYIPTPGKPIITPGKPGGGDPGGYDPGETYPWEPGEPKPPHKHDPIIYTPEIGEPVIPPWEPFTPGEIPIIDDLFAPSSPFIVTYEEIDPIKIIGLEYTKNSADLYLYYTNKLKNVLDRYCFTSISSIITSNKKTGDNKSEEFLLGNLTMADINVDANLKHLVDIGIRGEVTGLLKLQFCLNVFSLESTLYHMKNFKVCKDLRTRYEEEKMSADGTKEGSKSDRMLTGLRETYDKKYETSYINLYKHLNSSVAVLEETLNAYLLAISAKETLLKKGGKN
jgi:hypothetical protein